MKKALKITLYILGSLILLNVLLFVFHDPIIRFALKRALTYQTKGAVELEMEKFDLDLIEGQIVILQPGLVFDTLHPDPQKRISVSRILFEKIEIDQLDIRQLIVHRRIVASRFLVDRPQFWFIEKDIGPKSSFHPDQFIQSLQDSPPELMGAEILIDDVEINYGSIRITEADMPGYDPGVVDFTLIFKGFNSAPDSSEQITRYLFSEEILFRIRNLRRLLQSGYLLEIDSAVFSTKNRDLIVGGIDLQPAELTADEHAISLHAGQVKMNEIGLQEVRGMEDLSMSSVMISDGYFINYRSEKSVSSADTASGQGLNMLSKVLHDFMLDSAGVKNFRFYQIRNLSDTLVFADEIHFFASAIHFDSSAFDDLIRNVGYGKVSLGTGKVETRFPGQVDLSYSRLDYSTETNELRVAGLEITGDTSSAEQKLHVGLAELFVDSLSLDDVRNGRIGDLVVKVNDPEIDIDLGHPVFTGEGEGRGTARQRGFRLQNLQMNNGNLQLLKQGEFIVNLDGFDLGIDELQVNPGDTNLFTFSDVFFRTDETRLAIREGTHRIETGQVVFDDNQLSILRSGWNHRAPNPQESKQVRIDRLVLDELDLDQLFKERRLSFGTFSLVRPLFSGGIALAGKEEGPEKDVAPTFSMPLDLDYDKMELSGGRIDASLFHDTALYSVAFNYDLTLDGMVMVEGDSLKSLLQQLNWNLIINRLQMQSGQGVIGLNRLNSNSFSSELSLDRLTIRAPKGLPGLGESFVIDSLNILEISLNRINYALLLENDSLSLGRLTISEPEAWLQLHPKERADDKVRPLNIDLKQYQLFSYDTLELSGLDLGIRSFNDSSQAVIMARDFNFAHNRIRDGDQNLLTNLRLSLAEFSLSDSLRDQHLNINGCMLMPGEKQFSIAGIRGGNLSKLNQRQADNSLAGTSFETSGIRFSGIHISDTLPSMLEVERLEIGGLDYNMNRKPGTSGKMNFKLNLEILSSFSKTLHRLRLNTVALGNINFHYRTIDDTSSRSVRVDSIGITINRIQLDTTMIGQSEPDLIGDLTVDLKNRTTVTHDSLYEIRTGLLHYDFPRRKITIDSLIVKPRFEDSLFFKKAVYQTDRAYIRGARIELNDFNTDALFRDNHIHFGSAHLVDFNFELGRDKRYPFKPGIYRPMPREQITSIEQHFTIDSLLLSNAYLRYTEVDAKTGLAGMIFFDDVQVAAYNLTNKLAPGDRSTHLSLKVHGNVMGNTHMDMALYFPLFPDSVTFWLSGRSERLEMSDLNPITENLLGIGIMKGKGSVDIPLIMANDSVATGSLVFRYKKLRLAMYNRKKEQLNQGIMSPLINFLINDLIVRSNNPRFARKPRVGQVYFERDTRKGVVNYAWKSMLSGMLSTLGFNSREQRQEKREMKKSE